MNDHDYDIAQSEMQSQEEAERRFRDWLGAYGERYKQHTYAMRKLQSEITRAFAASNPVEAGQHAAAAAEALVRVATDDANWRRRRVEFKSRDINTGNCWKLVRPTPEGGEEE